MLPPKPACLIGKPPWLLQDDCSSNSCLDAARDSASPLRSKSKLHWIGEAPSPLSPSLLTPSPFPPTHSPSPHFPVVLLTPSAPPACENPIRCMGDSYDLNCLGDTPDSPFHEAPKREAGTDPAFTPYFLSLLLYFPAPLPLPLASESVWMRVGSRAASPPTWLSATSLSSRHQLIWTHMEGG